MRQRTFYRKNIKTERNIKTVERISKLLPTKGGGHFPLMYCSLSEELFPGLKLKKYTVSETFTTKFNLVNI